MPKPPSSSDLQHVQPHPGSIAVKSSAKEAFRRFSVPTDVIALPKRLVVFSFYISTTSEKLTAVLVGQTQSNISAPSATETTRSSGYPTPITYRGFCSGRRLVHVCTLRDCQSIATSTLKLLTPCNTHLLLRHQIILLSRYQACLA